MKKFVLLNQITFQTNKIISSKRLRVKNRNYEEKCQKLKHIFLFKKRHNYIINNITYIIVFI